MLKTFNATTSLTLPSLLCCSVFADDHKISSEPQPKVSPIASTPTCILASARPEVVGGVDLFITADLLIWQTQASGLGYAILDKEPNEFIEVEDLNRGFMTKGHVKNPHFSYQYGVNVGLGCNMSHDGWDAKLSWTWFRDTSKNAVTVLDASSSIYPTFMSNVAAFVMNDTQGVYFTPQRARSTYWLQLDLLDLEMGRDFYASKWLALRPFFGLRSAWIKQSYQITYKGLAVASSSLPFTGYINDMTNNFWGLGPRMGLNGEWQFGGGFSLYGNAAFSLLYGFFHLNQQEDLLKNNSDTDKVKLSGVGNSFHSIKAATDLEVGIRWDYMFFHDALHIGLHAGWQQELFFAQNQLMSFPSFMEFAQFYQNQADLGFQGWTLGARFDF